MRLKKKEKKRKNHVKCKAAEKCPAWLCVPVRLRFGRREGHPASFWSQDMTATQWATFPSRAQAQRWAGSLVNTLNFHMSMEDFSQTPL